jgi:hypothetical protein
MQLAGFSAAQHLLGVRSVSPAQLLVSCEGSSMQLHNVSHRDLLIGSRNDAGAPTFRLSRNLQRVVGPLCHAGQFDATLASALFALAGDRAVALLADHLRLVLRDDLMEPIVGLNEDTHVAAVPPEVEAIVQKVVAAAKESVPAFAQPSPTPTQEVSTVPLNVHITQLINQATSDEACARMPVSAQYWL